MTRETLVLCCSVGLLLAARGFAQTGPNTVEFSFSNPGARSMGFGGAFVALADDATAAFANPAGLVQLNGPEVSIEGRLWSYATPFTEGGRISGPPTGIGLDTTPGLRTGISSDSLSGLSFLSLVYPKGPASLAVYRHQLANFKAASMTDGLFGTTPRGEPFRFRDLRTVIELRIVSYGASGAYRLSDNFSLGIGVAYFVGKFTSEGDIFAPVTETLPDGFFGHNIYYPGAATERALARLDDSSWGVSGGFLWQVEERWSLGAVYRQGPSFELSVEERAGPALDPIVPEGTLLESDPDVPIHFPDVFGLGVAFKSNSGAITATAEWDYVRYSAITDSLVSDLVDEDAELDDVNEFHLGFEYAFVTSAPVLAFRLGAWLDPDHRIRNNRNALTRALFQSGEDHWHFALGFGLAFQRFQFDLGIDLSKLRDTASASVIFSF